MDVTADQLYRFIVANAEEIDGRLVCRASLIAYLRERGVHKPGRLRKHLVRELENAGLIKRKHPRSTHLYILTERQPAEGQPAEQPLRVSPPAISANQLYQYILQNAEVLDGRRLCRVSLIAYLKDRGVNKPGQLRKRLVRELEVAGVVKRKHPRSSHLYILTDDQPTKDEQPSIPIDPPSKRDTDAKLNTLLREIGGGTSTKPE